MNPEMPHFSELELKGSFIKLVPLQADHASSLLRAVKENTESYRFTSVPLNEEEMTKYIATAVAEREQDRCLPFAVLDLRRDKLVGSTRFYNLEYWQWPAGQAATLDRKGQAPDAVEIGWSWLAASAQRSYANTEMKMLMLTFAFEVWQVHRLTLKTDSRNERSRSAILRIGAKLDGVWRSQMPAFDGGIRDSAYYSILRGEWPSVKAALLGKLRGP